MGSQGDLLTGININETEVVKPISKAPAGTGQLIRDASREGNDNKLASLLSKWKGDPVINEGDDIGTTPLHTAASHHKLKCVQLLLENGADKSMKNHLLRCTNSLFLLI